MRQPEAVRERGPTEPAGAGPVGTGAPRRVLLVGTEWGPVDDGAGGLEHVVVGWARALSARHHVVVASVDGGGGIRRAGEPFRRISVPDSRALPGRIEELAIDVVQLNNRPGWVRLVAASAPVVLTLHNGASAWRDTRGPETDGELAAGLRLASAVTAVSRSLAADVETGWPVARERVHVTYPFADPVFFPARTTAKGGVVLFPNRLLRKKGVATVLECARGFGAAGPDFVFLDNLSPWKAPTDEHLALRAAVAATPNCRLVPPLPDRRRLGQMMASSSVVLLPAVEPEGFGLVSVEAQAAGTHAVVSDLGGLPETVASGRWTAPPADPDALGDRIREALAAPVPPASTSAWVSSRFSLGRSAAALEQVLAVVARAGA